MAAAAGHPLGIPRDVRLPAATSDSPDAIAWIVFVVGGMLIALAWAASLRAQPLRVRMRGSGVSST